MKVNTMEILDRNNIMQLAQNLNFDSKAASQNVSSAFIDMIKASDVKPAPDSTNSQIAQKQENFQQLTSGNKKDVKGSNNNNKTTSQDKKVKETAPKAKDKAPVKKTKTLAEDNAQVQNNNVVSQEIKSTATENDNIAINSLNVASADTEQTEQSTPSSDFEIALDNVEALTLNMESLDMDLTTNRDFVSEQPLELAKDAAVSAELPKDNVTVADVDVEVPQNILSTSEVFSKPVEKPVEDLDFDLPTSEDGKSAKAEVLPVQDELLIKQAQILDQKVISDKPLKIEVNVDTAKIAEPRHQEILQNSFEITSMLQNSENTQEVSYDSLPQLNSDQIIIDDAQQPIETTKTKTETTQPQIDANYTLSTVETVASAHIENEVLSSQAQEVQAVNLQNLSHRETIVKLQDLNTDASLKGLSKEVVEQVKVNITKSAVKGVDTIDIELKPEELGKVQVRMYISKDGKLHADIVTSRQETADLLQREIESLSKAFQDAGYDTDKQNFNFSFQKENQAGNQHSEQKLQQFIGETLEQEAEDNLANDNMIYDPRRGLNIRV